MKFTDTLWWLATGKVPTRAEKLLRLAEKGNTAAQSELGLCYHTGDGISRNVRESMRWFILAARQGDAQAQYYLGRAYSSGEGVPKDIESAYTWLERSAEQGYKKAAEWKSILMKEMPPEQIDKGSQLAQETQGKPIPPRPGFST